MALLESRLLSLPGCIRCASLLLWVLPKKTCTRNPGVGSAAVPAAVVRASRPHNSEGETPSGQPARCRRYILQSIAATCLPWWTTLPMSCRSLSSGIICNTKVAAPEAAEAREKKMKRLLICTVVVLAGFAVQAGSMAAVAQEQTKVTSTSQGAAEATKSGMADGASSPDEMGNRRPLYRLRKKRCDRDQVQFRLRVRPDPQRAAGRFHRTSGHG